MTVEWGHFALILAFALSLCVMVSPFWGKRFETKEVVLFAEKAALAQFFLISFASFMLIRGFLKSDFSLLHVALNSHSLKPIFYKIAASWGHHEGSLLLWVFVLSLFSMLFSVKKYTMMRSLFRLYVLAVQAAIGSAFLAFMLFLSPPFARLFPVPVEGEGLNPLLQDPGLVIHPPLLYMGYVGISMGFSFAAALLLDPKMGSKAIGWMRSWVALSWIFLTAGVATGSQWAYRELGWGGYWFWDPVENVSLIPWLLVTALLHSSAVSEKRGALTRWTLLLAIFGFSSSLLGTFLVRSGLLTSVHAFSSDPARGFFILLILFIATGGTLLLFALRAHHITEGGVFRPISRESALLFNNMILCSAAGTVLLGTIYPVILAALELETISVGTPYYAATFLPLAAFLGIGLGLGIFIPWKGFRRAPPRQVFLVPAYIFGLIFGFSFLLNWRNIIAAFGFTYGFWLIALVLIEAYQKLKLPVFSWSVALKRVRLLSSAVWGMSFAHLGIAVLIVGVTASSALGLEKIETVTPGENVRLGKYEFNFQGIEQSQGHNYRSLQGNVLLRFSSKEILLKPERRFYVSGGNETTEAAIYRHFLTDIYVAMGVDEGVVTLRFYVKPWVDLIWFGAFLMVIGGILSLRRRARQET